MTSDLQASFDADPTDDRYASRAVDALLAAGVAAGASDVHLQPTPAGLDVAWRVDGVLQAVGRFPRTAAANIVARLQVIAGLLTYHTETPQEGRIRGEQFDMEMRVSTFPTLHGQRAVVRLFDPQQETLALLADLGLPDEIAQRLRRLLAETTGAILFCGPAGSGKTTTAYACLREILADSHGGRSIASLEDPIEVAVPGVAQSQVNEAAGFTMPGGLRSLLRQDPEVILVGEIRDRPTAELAMQAALTGSLVVTTFHAPSAAVAVTRLADMGVEPYILRSGLLAVVAGRLVRRLCDCAQPGTRDEDRLGLAVENFHMPVGCDDCRQSGYRGRTLLAELLLPGEGDLPAAVLSRCDAATLQELAVNHGMTPLSRHAHHRVESGDTSPAEIRRVLGFQ